MTTTSRRASFEVVCACVATLASWGCGRTALDVLRPTPDRSEVGFGTNGRFVLDIGSTDTATFTFQGIAEDLEGRLLLVGRGGPSDVIVARILDTGFIDTSFASSGYAHIAGIAQANSVAIADDGKVVVVGEYDSGFDRGAVVRLNDDGSFDSGFGTEGVLAIDASPQRELYNGIITYPDGSVVIGGQAGTEGAWDANLAKVTAAGALDPSFGVGGSRRDNLSDADEFLTMVGDASRRPHVMGNGFFTDRFTCVVARYTIAGTRDASFGNGGVTSLNPADADESTCPALAFTSNGGLVLVGSATRGSATESIMWRLDAAGDELAGAARESGLSGNDTATSVVVLADGRIVMGGTVSGASPTGYLWVLHGDGTPDESVGLGGFVPTDLVGVSVQSLLVDQEGRVVVYGTIERDGRELAMLTRVLL